jgi:hypothetical protein
MIRDFVCKLEEYSDEIWRHFCKIRNAKTKKELFDGLKGIAKIIDSIL